MQAPDQGWPLSAAATAMLRDPKLASDEVLKLVLKELVLRRVWSLRRDPKRRLRAQRIEFSLGTQPAPAIVPLPEADRALRAVVGADGREVQEAVRRMLKDHRKLPDQLRDAVRDELADRGLVELGRRKVLGLVPRTTVVLTASGRAWAEDAQGRTNALARSIGRPAREVLTQATALGGLVLLLDPGRLAELDDVVRRLRDDVDFGDLDFGALDGLDSSFDGAVDAGASDGGAGDGGAGDGGAAS